MEKIIFLVLLGFLFSCHINSSSNKNVSSDESLQTTEQLSTNSFDLEEVISKDGLVFLDTLELVFNSSGIKGVINLVENSYPVGSIINMDYGIDNEPLYRIARVTITYSNTDEIIWSDEKEAPEVEYKDNYIGGTKWPYGENPFQINIFGIPIE